MNPLFLFRKEMTPIRKLLMLHLASGGKLIEESATGNPLSFETNISKALPQFSTAFTPTQSGTGDPYPPGGGKNKFNPDAPIVTVVNSGGNNRSAIRLGLTNCTVTFSATAKTAGALPSYNINVGTYKNDVVVDTTGIISASTGATTKTITFAADEEAILVYAVSNNTLFAEDLTKFNIQAEIGESATSFMPYSNIRPISGWTGVNVWHYPENKLNITNTSGTISQGITFTPIKDSNNVVRSVHVEGTKSGSNVFYNFNYAVGTLSFPVGSYKVSGYSSICAFRVYAITNGSESKIFDSQNQTGFTVTSDMTQVWMRIQVMCDVGQTVNETVYPIVIASDATLSSYPVVFPDSVGTVYGGTLDLTTGVLTATWKQVMLGGRDWATNSSNEQFIMLTTKLTDSVVCENNDKTVRCYCDQFKAVSAYKATNRDAQNPQAEYDTAIISSNRLYTVQSIDKFPNSQSFSVWCNSNNVQVVYELETPFTIATLTPQQITALVGDNVIWSDTNGTNTAVYLKKG